MSRHNKQDKSLLKNGMKISVIEGIFAQIFSSLSGIGSNFITKTAVLLNASPLHFSLLTGISQLSQFFQLYAVIHNQRRADRKEACISYAFWGRLLIAFLGISFVFTNKSASLVFFLSLLFVSASLQTVSGSMWVAWMTELIPGKIRGRFFSFRMQIHLLFGLLTGYVFSFIVDLFELDGTGWRQEILSRFNLITYFSVEKLPLVLSIMFITATFFGLYGLKILKKQPERKIIKPKAINDFNLLEPLKNQEFKRLLLFGMIWMFAIGIGSPFWGPFMLKVLKMSLIEMQIYTMLSSAGMFLSFRVWGKFVDKYGNKNAMKICVFMGSINSFFWLFFTENSYNLIWLEAFLSGVMWSGANLVSFNFVLSLSPRGKEQHWSAVYSAITGFIMLSTILLSGMLYPPKLYIFNMTLLPEQVLFAITGICRLLAEIPLHFVKENKNLTLRDSIKDSSDIVLARLIRFRNKMFKIFNI